MKDPNNIFNRIRPSKCRQRLEWELDATCVDCNQKLPSQKVVIYFYFLLCRIVAGLLTGCGLDFLAEKVSGPRVDSATLQLIG
eukprot:952333-Amphidinium_carterae.1